MLTYEEKDSKWENWDGGYWGKDIYKKKNSSKFFKCCCVTFILCLMLFMITLSIMYIITEGQIICFIPYVKKVEFCINHNTKNSTNNTNIQNQTNIFNVMDTNNSSISNDTKYTNDTNDEYNQNDFIYNNNSLSQISQYINKTNYTNYMLYRENIQNQIENSKESSINDGEAIAISIGSVFGFIILSAGSFYTTKKGYIGIKNYCTNKTSSKHKNIQLTEEEMKFYEVKNPLQEAFENNQGGLFQKGVYTIKKAIEKDRERDFDSAISLYNNGIDIILQCLKTNFNSNDRFAIAKKIDIYVQRVNYITNCKENQKLINDINNNFKSK